MEPDRQLLRAFDGKDWKLQAQLAVGSEPQYTASSSNRATERASSVAFFGAGGNVTDLWFGQPASDGRRLSLLGHRST